MKDLLRRVVAEVGVYLEIVKISGIKEMMTAGIMSTAAVAVDGSMTVSGHVP